MPSMNKFGNIVICELSLNIIQTHYNLSLYQTDSLVSQFGYSETEVNPRYFSMSQSKNFRTDFGFRLWKTETVIVIYVMFPSLVQTILLGLILNILIH